MVDSKITNRSERANGFSKTATKVTANTLSVKRYVLTTKKSRQLKRTDSLYPKS